MFPRMTGNPKSANFPWLFFGLTYGLSWTIWITFILSGERISGPGPALIVACSMPSLAGILLTCLTGDGAVRHDFWRRVIRFKLIGLRSYNNTHRSILSAVLLHFMFNSVYGIMGQEGQPLPLGFFTVNTVLMGTSAAAIIGLWGAKTMTSLRNAERT